MVYPLAYKKHQNAMENHVPRQVAKSPSQKKRRKKMGGGGGGVVFASAMGKTRGKIQCGAQKNDS